MGGSPSTRTEAGYAPEFAPLAVAAREQIMALQGQNPLGQYAQALPGGTAGLSPFQIAGMQLIPSLLASSPAMTELGKIAGPVSQAALHASMAGDVTPGAQAALRALAPRLGSNPTFSQNRLSGFANMASAPGASAQLPGSAVAPTVLPGVTPEWLNQNMGGSKLFQSTPFGYFDRATGKIVPYPPGLQPASAFAPVPPQLPTLDPFGNPIGSPQPGAMPDPSASN